MNLSKSKQETICKIINHSLANDEPIIVSFVKQSRTLHSMTNNKERYKLNTRTQRVHLNEFFINKCKKQRGSTARNILKHLVDMQHDRRAKFFEVNK